MSLLQDEDRIRIVRLNEVDRDVMLREEMMLHFDVNRTKKDIKIKMMSFENAFISTI